MNCQTYTTSKTKPSDISVTVSLLEKNGEVQILFRYKIDVDNKVLLFHHKVSLDRLYMSQYVVKFPRLSFFTYWGVPFSHKLSIIIICFAKNHAFCR